MAEPGEVLTRIAAVRALPPEAAGEAVQALFEAQVVCALPQDPAVFVFDETNGVYVNLSKRSDLFDTLDVGD